MDRNGEQSAMSGSGAGARSASPPPSTYRLQLQPGFGFSEAAGVVPYLERLGVGALYLSPILEAAPGSTHGYDVVDHSRISPALGGDEGFAALRTALAKAGLGLIVDLVPNHMGIGAANGWWMDVLENGPSSVHANRFDIDWRPTKDELEYKVLLPVLGDQYGTVLERGELLLVRDGGSFLVRYFDQRFPIAPRSVPTLLRQALAPLGAELGAEHPDLQELASLCTALEKLAPRELAEPAAVAERAREKEVAKRRLAALCASTPPIAREVDVAVASYNGVPGDARSFDRLHALLDEQAYRLAYWRVAGDEINYRRFFDVNGLAAIRMEEPTVFEDAHRRLLELVREGTITGLRIDHPDGLYDPPGYFRRLQAAVLAHREMGAEGAAPDPAALRARVDGLAAELARAPAPVLPLFVVAEKILAPDEQVPDSWAVHGTTGYEFLNAVNGLFVDAAAARVFTTRHSRFRGQSERFADVAQASRREVCASLMSSEIQMLARRLDRASETDRRTRDFTHSELTRALIEYVTLLPIYRTYVPPDGAVDARDRGYVEATIARARRRALLLDPSLFDFLRDVLLLRAPPNLGERERAAWLEFALRLQQLTGAISAKALEDTAFYAHVRLASLNEVGGDPARFGVAPAAFHRQCAARLARWPGSLLATTTHDTKRSEDTRLRIDALSELGAAWWDQVKSWSAAHRRLGHHLDGERAPSREEESLLYQTIVGTLPEGGGPGRPGWEEYVERISAYMRKALREAKVHTSWTHPHLPWEEAVAWFVTALLHHEPFVASAALLVRRVAAAARLSSLSQLALKLAAPGVTDTYQGTELWDLSLVDPDNRRPVDFAHRVALLEALDGAPDRRVLARELSLPAALPDGRAKLLLLATGLRLRRDDPALFLGGSYEPLEAVGPDAVRVVAFARRRPDRRLVAVAPRFHLSRLDAELSPRPLDATIALGDAPLRDAVTGVERSGTTALADLLSDFPVALLVGERG